jgi:hypothetical protein
MAGASIGAVDYSVVFVANHPIGALTVGEMNTLLVCRV